jgi:divalent metal cation (Fe/Co/Zn/Cd) transporter
LREEWGGAEEEEAAEHRARKLIGLSFLVLAAYIGAHSVITLMGWLPRPEQSLIGFAVIVASAVVMSLLYVGKMRAAVQMDSRALRGEAIESLVCDLQDFTILIGLGLYALLGWWWADPIAALGLIPFLIKEGREGVSGHEHEDEEGASKVCFCRSCYFGLRSCALPCCTSAA